MKTSVIRARTMWALFAVGAFTALLVGLVMGKTLISAIFQQVRASNQQKASSLRTHVLQQVQQAQKLLELVARDPEVQEFRASSLDRPLGHAIDFNPAIDSIYAYDAAGTLIMRRYPTGVEAPEEPGKNFPQMTNELFRSSAEACLADGVSRRLPIKRTHTGTLFIPCLASVPGPDGKSVGVLSGAVWPSGEGFQKLLDALVQGERGYVVLLGDSGQIIARTANAPGELGAEFPHRQEGSGGQRVEHAGGTDFVAWAELEGLGVEVVAGIPRQEALAVLPRALAELAAVTLGALVLAGLLGMWFSERLTGPMTALLEGVRLAAKGVLNHRVPVEGEDELAAVSRAFNGLVEQLARSRMIDELWQTSSEVDVELEDLPESEE